MTTITATVAALRSLVEASPLDRELRLAYADALEEAGAGRVAVLQRLRANQTTREGEQVVTVGRAGTDQAGTGGGYAVPVYTTKVYEARRRAADGLLTWRLVRTLGGHHRTAGRQVSTPMLARAEAYAERHGLEVLEGVRHGTVCP